MPGPYERHLLAGSGYVLGSFHCPPDSARWREPNWIGERPHVVLPSTAVRIGAGTAPGEVRTVNEVVVYVTIGVPVGLLAAAVDAPVPLEVLESELLPHADMTSAATMPAAARTNSQRRRPDGAPLLSRPCICDLLMGEISAALLQRARYEVRVG